MLVLRPTADITRRGTDEDLQPSPTDSNETEENEISIVSFWRRSCVAGQEIKKPEKCSIIHAFRLLVSYCTIKTENH